MTEIVAAVLASALLAPAGVLVQGPPLSACGNSAIDQVTSHTPAAGVPRTATLGEAARLAGSLLSSSLQQPQPKQQSWAGRHPVLAGTLIGASIGAVAKGTLLGLPWDTCIADSETTGCAGASMAIGAGIGAGMGALVGLVVSVVRR